MSKKEQKKSMRMCSILLVVVATIVFAPALVLAGNVLPPDLHGPAMKHLSEVELRTPIDARVKVETNTVKDRTSGKLTKARVDESYGKRLLYFIQNDGQVDEQVKFYVQGSGHMIFFTKDGIYLNLTRVQTPREGLADPKRSKTSAGKSELLKLSFLNAKKEPRLIAGDLQEGKFNYFVGNNPAKWRTDIPTYGAVVYEEVYRNIDIKFYGNSRQLEYDVIVKPGGDPACVKFLYEGAKGLHVNTLGELEIALENGTVTQKTPYLYQEIDGRRVPVQGRFKLLDRTSFGFEVASYDTKRPLTIDPVIEYSRYIGGDQYDRGFAIAIDNDGNAYITGDTNSSDFPGRTTNPLDYHFDVFVTKFGPTGSRLYSTVLGGTQYDDNMGTDKEGGRSIAVDDSGYAHITGIAPSSDFPTTPSAFQGTHGSGIWDAFYTVITPSGGLAYSSFLGGVNSEFGYGITLDSAKNAYITGEVRPFQNESPDFPTVLPFQPALGGGVDAFVVKINFDPQGTPTRSVAFATYLGGDSTDVGTGIAVNNTGNIYITGQTRSTDFPGTSTSLIQSAIAGGYDAFVTRMNASGSSIGYSTYIGGNRNDLAKGIAVDNAGSAYITGYIEAPETTTGFYNFPLVSPIQDELRGWNEAFVTKINAAGDDIVYSTLLGGSGGDSGLCIAVDSSGTAYIAGGTNSEDFPIVSPIDGHDTVLGAVHPEGFYRYGDSLIARINADGNGLLYATYFGGDGNNISGDTGSDYAYGIAVDDNGNAYITGETTAKSFPAPPLPPDYEPEWQWKCGDPFTPCDHYRDGFIAKISDSGISPSEPSISVTPLSYDFGGVAQYDASTHQVTISNYGTEDLDIDSIAMVTGTDYSVERGGSNPCSSLTPTISPGENCTVEVTFSPQSLGISTDTLRIRSNDPDDPTVNASFEGVGVSLPPPDIDVSPLELIFNNVVEHTPSPPLQVTILNTGGSNLQVTQIVMESDFFPDRPDMGFSVEEGGSQPCGDLTPVIAAGENCTVEVTFTPREVANDITEILHIYSNDSADPIVDVALSGNGIEDTGDACPNDPDKTEPGICGCGVADTDSDGDGSMDCVEGAGPNNGDSNNDGTQDSQQDYVASLETNDGQDYVTLESPDTTNLSDVQAISNPSPGDAPANEQFPYGFFEFTINDVGIGGATTLTLVLPPGSEPDSYFKYGPTPSQPVPHWYAFMFDGETGAVISGNTIVLHFVDGRRGDDNPVEDARIIEPGAPAHSIASTTTTTSVGGGGCTTDGECNDENDCTDDTCENGLCNNIPVADGTACDDGFYCTTTDTCEEGVCEGTGNPCTESSTCNEETQSCDCNDDADCDDGIFCNGTEVCDPDAGCRPSSNPCTDDGEYCNGVESCDEEADECVSTGNPCGNDQTCDEDNDTCAVLPVEHIECSTNALGSSFFLLPGLVTIKGMETSFTMLDSQVNYDPAVVIPLFKLVNPTTQTITQLVFVLPSIMLPAGSSYPITVTVTVDGLSDAMEIGAFIF